MSNAVNTGDNMVSNNDRSSNALLFLKVAPNADVGDDGVLGVALNFNDREQVEHYRKAATSILNWIDTNENKPTRDPRQDLKVGDMVRFELTGVITARQSAGIVKDYDGNDFEPVQYVIKDHDKRITNYVPYHQILTVIGKEEE